MKIPFILLSENSGTPMTGQASNIEISISKDGGQFAPSANAAEEFSPGYYSIELTEDELSVEQFAVIEIVCPDAQLVVKQWTPDSGGTADKDAIAEAVWTRKPRQLTSDAHEIIVPETSDVHNIIEPNRILKVTSEVNLTIEPNN
ncbi:MAG: hypothetical protein IJG38_02335 [Thermoguttaceae bacterium]|nr:hypothetical protein [Thermoguttaceae bacterium]